MSLLIRNARLVATMDDADRRLEAASVLIEGGRIAALGPDASLVGRFAPAQRVIDGADLLVTPGLVNTHHHLYQTLTRALPGAQDAPLFDWLLHHYPIWRHLDADMLAIATRTGLAELLLSGCTLTSDHHYLYPAGTHGHLVDVQIEEARALGIRFQPTRGSMSLGESAGGLPPDAVCQSEATILADCRRLAASSDPAPGAMLRIDLAPCSPFSVTADTLRATAALAREAGLRLHTHVAETLDEERYCLEQFGRRPVAHMHALGWTGPDVWYAHAVHLDDSEIALLGETGTGVAHCPSSNMRLGSGVARIKELLAAGAPVGLAVDGSASNDGSRLLPEARQMLLLSRLRKPAHWLTVDEVWRVATRGGAAVLGRAELGSIAPGQWADLALWDLGGLEMAGAQADPLGGLLLAGAAAAPRPRFVIVNGRVVVDDGRIPGLDERAHAGRHNAAAATLLERALAEGGA
ncbi:MAG: 8-oxoguanine deaminase [Candidatus Krumholzibacteriia bacterium]|nr:8-oxoguanine deaminase [bacterium]MCB9517184.1 8-oxoguanine deaminase [Candidatus Latescibacterota bacterium]